MAKEASCEANLRKIVKKTGTIIAGLIDPDDFSPQAAGEVAAKIQKIGASAIFVGGSTVADQSELDSVVMQIKKNITIPVILFPGNVTGVSRHADAILFSSLLNSTNPYFIIGAQALGALQVRKYSLEAIPMGYLVFTENSSTGFIGQVRAIPYDKPSIAVAYAMAAQYMGMRALYLEAGSGAEETMPPTIVSSVRRVFDGLLIVGGGITKPDVARHLSKAGADVLVIGNLLQSAGFEAKLTPIIRAVRGTRF